MSKQYKWISISFTEALRMMADYFEDNDKPQPYFEEENGQRERVDSIGQLRALNNHYRREEVEILQAHNLTIEDFNLLDEALNDVVYECKNSMSAWAPYNSAHEGFGVLKEEVDELWDQVRLKQKNRKIEDMRKEAVQVASVALRFIVDICNEEKIRR